MPTGIPWLDEIVENSGLPKMADFEAARLIYNHVACDSVSPHTFRRYDIYYKLIGRTRRYLISDVVAFAKQRIEQAPSRKPPPRRRKLPAATATFPGL